MTPDSCGNGDLRRAVWLLFNGDVPATQALLREHVAAKPEDPLGYSLSAALPFYNLVAGQLRSHYGNSVGGMVLGESLGLPPGMRQMLGGNLQRAQTQAKEDLATNPQDENALFALCVADGVNRDVMALVFKRWMTSFSHAQMAARRARQLLALNPNAYDAYFVIGFSEHLIQKIPSIFRPFTKIPGIVGQNSRAIQFLEATAHDGYYFREFARQMLLTLYTEEGRHQDMLRTLSALAADFPGNTIYHSEWLKYSTSSPKTSI